MANPTADGAVSVLSLGLDRGGAAALHVQLYLQIRDLILGGRLAPGARLPSTRALAAELGVSRTTTVAAYDQLASEGYLEGRTGAGAFVAAELPDTAPPVPQNRMADTAPPPHLSARGTAMARRPAPGPAPVRPFDPAAPDRAAFPVDEWSRLLARSWRRPDDEALWGRTPGGYPPLRAAIAEHLRLVRGLPVSADQVIVTTGMSETIGLLTAVLTDPGDPVWVEDPGYRAARRTIAEAGATPVAVAVDDQGFSPAAAQAAAPGARLALVTPSRQYPLGQTMPLARRLALLDWARDAGAWVLEDDYDSEYRYAGRPLAALASLDGHGRVVYLGSFSRAMFPSLRLAYAVAPPGLAPVLLRAQAMRGVQTSAVGQPALAGFMESGRFAAHIRRMRRLYGRRLAHMKTLFAGPLAGLLDPLPADAGMHVTALLSPRLAARMDDVEASRRAAANGVTAAALSSHYAGTGRRQGLLLGFACAPESELTVAAGRLAAALA